MAGELALLWQEKLALLCSALWQGKKLALLCSALTGFHHLTELLAYLAAEELAGGEPAGAKDVHWWNRLAGDGYKKYRDALAPLPPADLATSCDELDTAAFAVAETFDPWLEQIGFDLRDEGSGIYFDALRHDF